MASDCAALGTFARLLVEPGAAPHTYDGSSERYDFLYETMGSTRLLNGGAKITGTRSRYDGALRGQSYLVHGVLALQPGADDLTYWLPRIFGGTLAGTDVPLAETLPSFGMLIDRENEIFEYTDCFVNQAILRGQTANGSEGDELLELVIHIIGKTEVKDKSWPGTPPALATDDLIDQPYAITDSTLTLNSNSRQFDKFNMIVDNKLMVRFRNSLTAQCIRPTDREIKLETTNPFIAAAFEEALSANTTAISGSIALTNSTVSTTFAFNKLRNVFKTPTARGKGEIPLELQMIAGRDESNPEITITHDATA